MAFGGSRFGSFSAAGRDIGLVDPFWVFLAPGHFAAKTPADECWIVLDFLGFSRPNQDVSMGYAGFSGKSCSPSVSAGPEARKREPAVQAMRKGRIVHGATLICFLTFCKRLPPAPFPFGRLNPKATRTRIKTQSVEPVSPLMTFKVEPMNKKREKAVFAWRRRLRQFFRFRSLNSTALGRIVVLVW